MYLKHVNSEEDAKLFLDQIRALIKKNGMLFMNSLEKNTRSLADLGITVDMQKKIINDLEASDYCKGPEPDIKYPQKDIAVFGYDFRGTELYIKFSISIDQVPVVCLSFHESEEPMKYPYN